MHASTPQPPGGASEGWEQARLLSLAALLFVANWACQVIWLGLAGGLFPSVVAGALFGTLLPLALLARSPRWAAVRELRLRWPSPAAAGGSIVVALCSLAPGSVLGWVSLQLHPVDPQWLARFAEDLPQAPAEVAVAALAVVVAAPLAEELVFRGLVHRSFSRTWGPWPAILLSSLVFSIVHFEPWYLLGLLAVGLMLGFVWEVTRSLACCWLAHAVHNAVSLAIMVADGPAGAEPPAPTPGGLALAGGSLLVLGLVGLRLWRSRPR